MYSYSIHITYHRNYYSTGVQLSVTQDMKLKNEYHSMLVTHVYGINAIWNSGCLKHINKYGMPSVIYPFYPEE